jgi:FYVE zinc finger
MLPFENYKFCHLCKSKFAILRRACHCRNCGVCVCKDCAVQWPAKMIPDTYNIKKEMVVNACKSCEWLSNSFRLALLEGNHDRAVSLHSTGNVNLHTPFANVKGELFYPVHCAVLGGNLDMLKFLVDENCCPIKSVRVAGTGKDPSNKYTPIVTSKGRSLLGIAMDSENLRIVRYLVAEKGLSLTGEKDLTHDLLCRNFEKLLRFAREDAFFDLNDHAGLEQIDREVLSLPVMAGDFTGLEPMAFVRNDSTELESHALNERTQVSGAPSQHEHAPRRRSSRGAQGTNLDFGNNPREECKSLFLSASSIEGRCLFVLY